MSKALATPVSRREFLKRSGLALAVVVGFPALLRIVEGADRSQTAPRRSGGYGTSAYGGPQARPRIRL